MFLLWFLFFFFQAEDGIRDDLVTGVQTCALPILWSIIIRGPTLHAISRSLTVVLGFNPLEYFHSKTCIYPSKSNANSQTLKSDQP